MKNALRVCAGFGLILLAGCGAGAPPALLGPTASSGMSTSASSVRIRFEDHLAFGARVERATVLLDGVAALEAEGATLHDEARLTVPPGAHVLGVSVRASEPCGLLDEPRTSGTVEATTSLEASGGPASIAIDVAGTEATRDPLRTLAVRFRGQAIELGVSLDERAPAGCAPSDALCAMQAFADRARARHDAGAAGCYETRRARVRALEDVIEDSHTKVQRPGTTTGEAEGAQLRARDAEEKIRAIAATAGACAGHEAGRAAVVERRIERVCPAEGTTAGLDPF